MPMLAEALDVECKKVKEDRNEKREIKAAHTGKARHIIVFEARTRNY